GIGVVDLPPCASRDAAIREQLLLEVQKPFDLKAAPLLRITLLRVALGESVLLLCGHHIVADYWSFSILLRELKEIYEALRRGVAPVLPPMRLQYADFAVWQRSPLASEALEADLNYWRRVLDGISPLELPADFPRNARQSFRGAVSRRGF